MERKPNRDIEDKLRQNLYSSIVNLISLMLLISVGVLLYGLFGDQFSFDFEEKPRIAQTTSRAVAEKEDVIVDGVHLASGLKVAEGFEVVRATCTACHSGKLVAQNRANRAGWKAMIVWMQETQGLWELGAQEDKILDYLAANYAPQEVGRRANLDAVEWYILED